MPETGRFGSLVGAIDAGTSSIRFIIFCLHSSEIVTFHQIPLKAIYPEVGWIEQDPFNIVTLIEECLKETVKKLIEMEVRPSDIGCIGITNQRETVVAWDKVTGKPFYNAIVWSDMRAQSIASKMIELSPNKDINYWKPTCGLPINSNFSAFKFKWILEKVPEVKKAANENRLCLGTIDSWVMYNLTGGPNGGIFVTDCTNASRTFLMNLETLQWDADLLKLFDIEQDWLPEIKSCSEIYGIVYHGPLQGIKISGCLGDQQAALLGHLCIKKGQVKSTYGTGSFLLCNTGPKKLNSKNGLLTTVAFKLGVNEPTMYALEGSVAVAGAALNWLKDNLEILDDAKSTETLGELESKTNDVYFVPAFSGMFAPYWEHNARGIIVGITENTENHHLVRAALEAVCFQTRDILEAIKSDCSFTHKELLVDGGMTENNLLMQLQANLAGIPVVRPKNSEMTAFGVALAAGSAKGIDFWKIDEFPQHPKTIFYPAVSSSERESKYLKWKKAVERSFSWASS